MSDRMEATPAAVPIARARRSSRRRTSRAEGAPRVGLMMGAGGVLGGAWLTGALQAITSETGWDPGSARHIVGTSSGAMVGAMIACGVPPWFMVAHSAGESFPGLRDANGELAESADRAAGAIYRLHRGVPQLGPGSWRLALSSVARPYHHSAGAMLAGWMPLGPISTEPLKEVVRRMCSDGWAPHPGFWAVAVDYRTGRRVAFGSAQAPHVDLADAVAASCAVPGFFRAVEMHGRRYIDGGVHSASNLDLLAGAKLDLAVVLNPLSSRRVSAPRSLGGGLAYVMRRQARHALRNEVRRLREAGTEVLVIEPGADDLEAMGANLMSRGRRNEVIERAVETMTKRLRSSVVGERLSQLPQGSPELLRRPRGAASRWPDFRALAESRWREEPAVAGARRARIPASQTA